MAIDAMWRAVYSSFSSLCRVEGYLDPAFSAPILRGKRSFNLGQSTTRRWSAVSIRKATIWSFTFVVLTDDSPGYGFVEVYSSVLFLWRKTVEEEFRRLFAQRRETGSCGAAICLSPRSALVLLYVDCFFLIKFPRLPEAVNCWVFLFSGRRGP